MFKDAEFTTTKDKTLVLKDWVRFLDAILTDNGESATDRFGRQLPNLYRKFSKRLYEHLHLHCSYIAHYDHFGFFSTYFDGIDEHTIGFFETLKNNLSNHWGNDDYKDINEAMLEELSKKEVDIFAKANGQQKEEDILQAKALLAKHKIAL